MKYNHVVFKLAALTCDSIKHLLKIVVSVHILKPKNWRLQEV